MRFVYLLAIVLLATTAVSARAPKKPYHSKQGDKAMEMFNYRLAIENYSAVLRHKKNDSIYPIRKIADCYRLLNEPANAKQWYSKLVDMPSADPLVRLYYADALRETQDYVGARKYYMAYKATAGNDKNIDDVIAGLDKVQDLTKDQGIYKIEIMPFNSAASDFGAAFYGKDSLFFSSNRTNKFTHKVDRWSYNDYYQVYKAPMAGGGLSKMINKRPNGRYHDGPVTYNQAVSLLIFTRSNYVRRAKAAKDRKTVNLKLFSMVYPYKKKPKLFSLPFNDNNFSNAHPSLTKDGKTLYFCSDRPGGYGGTDIYKVERVGDAWTTPVNLGPEVNSKYDEKFPFITDEGVLYFASDALGGLGGLDIYESHRDGNKWTTPVNLGAPVNSSYDDFALIYRDSTGKGYFTSNRKGGMGDDDIYGFTKKLNVEKAVTVRVVDGDSKQPIDGAAIDVPCANGRIKSYVGNGFGETKFMINPSTSCDVTAAKDGYDNGTVKIEYPVKPGSDIVIISLHKKANPLKLQMTVRERGTEQPVRDLNIVLKDDSKNAVIATYTTDAQGSILENIVPNDKYTISSPDVASITDGLSGEEKADENNIIRRVYYVDPTKRKLNVPITSDCFSPNTTVEVTNKGTGEVVRTRVDETGKIRMALRPNSTYVIASDDKTDELQTTDLKPGDVISLKCKFTVGQTWILNNIYYDLDKWLIRKDAAKELTKLAGVMKANPSLEIELGSHTDCRQTAAYNESLSVKRAKAAVSYIIQKGVKSRRILAAGYGESHLVNGCACEPTNVSPCTNEEHQLNRRTEVKVLKY